MKHLFFILLIVFSWNTVSAREVKLSKLKVSTAKKVKVPKSIEVDSYVFKKVKDQKYADSSYGTTRTYQAKELPEMVITLYIYPMSSLNVSAEHYMPYEFQLLNAGIVQAYENEGMKVAELNNETINFEEKQLFYSKHTLQSENSSLITESFLANVHLHFVKIRITFPSYVATKWQPVARNLVNLLIKNIEIKQHKDTKLQVNISMIDDNESINAYAVSSQLVYSLSLMKQLDEYDMILSFDEIKEAINNVILVNSERIEKEELKINPEQFITLNDLLKANLLDEFIWQNLYQPHWKKPKNLKLEKLESWLNDQGEKIFIPFESKELLRASY